MEKYLYIKYDNRLIDRARNNRKNETPAEKLIWNSLLRWKNLLWYKFSRQKMISYFIADFYCSELKLVIEIDWKIHDDRIDYDNERSIEFNKLWIKVIRFSNEEVLSKLDEVRLKLEYFINPPLTRGGAQRAEGFSKNILITWTSKWIGNYLMQNLKDFNNVIWISRSKSQESGLKEFNIDLTKHSLFNNIVKYLEHENIKLDTIIINAWVWHFWKFENWNSDKYEEIINLNLLSPIIMIKILEPYLNNKSKIIFIWSIISKKFMKYWAVYQASKFGLRWFAWALKNEMKGKSIHIINPRIVETTFHDESEIDIDFSTDKITSLDIIWETVNNIINWLENRFEIDL